MEIFSSSLLGTREFLRGRPKPQELEPFPVRAEYDGRELDVGEGEAEVLEFQLPHAPSWRTSGRRTSGHLLSYGGWLGGEQVGAS